MCNNPVGLSYIICNDKPEIDMNDDGYTGMREEHMREMLRKDSVKLSNRPKRDKKINQDDIINLQIALNTAKSEEEFLRMV